jgi:hypothetical protein
MNGESFAVKRKIIPRYIGCRKQPGQGIKAKYIATLAARHHTSAIPGRNRSKGFRHGRKPTSVQRRRSALLRLNGAKRAVRRYGKLAAKLWASFSISYERHESHKCVLSHLRNHSQTHVFITGHVVS